MNADGSGKADDRPSAEAVIREYYAALRAGDRLAPFFLKDDATTKVGVRELARGYDAVEAALTEQTESTAEWTVESNALTIDERRPVAVFADEVTLAWTDRTTGQRWRFETRWSGTLVESDDDESPAWRFHTMHVSAPHEL